MKQAVAERDLDDFKEAVEMYAKACPDVTYVQLEEAFRTQKVAIWLIAIEKELSATYTNMDLQGNLGKKHSISWRWSDKPRAPKEMDIWPATPDENLERLADAGQPIDCKMPKCSNCDALGHTQVCPYVIYPFEVIYSWSLRNLAPRRRWRRTVYPFPVTTVARLVIVFAIVPYLFTVFRSIS